MNAGELLELLAGDHGRQDLYRSAASARSRWVGDSVHLRGIIEFSNYCRMDCLYCGLRRSNTRLKRYRMPPGEIVEAAARGAGLGLKTVVLQSGEDLWYTADTVAGMVSAIKERAGVAVTLSVGEREKREYALWKRAGADRYLLKYETSDDALCKSLRPDSGLAGRLRRLDWLMDLGYEVGSGIIVGLPGQSLESIARDITFLRDLGVHMASAGPFIPHSNTPLGDRAPGAVSLSLATVACLRLELPWANIPATSALGTLDPAAQVIALRSGANVIMPDITPPEYRTLYEIYPGKVGCLETPAGSVERCRRLVQSAGLTVGTGFGSCVRARTHRPGAGSREINPHGGVLNGQDGRFRR